MRERKGDAVAHGQEPVRGVDHKGHKVTPWSNADEGVAGGCGKGAWSRKCNHGVGIGGGWIDAPHVYGEC
jgi:hypothetical protein